MMSNFVRLFVFVISVFLLLNGISTFPSSESTSMSLPKILRSHDIQDSHLERVYAKQETGFDGKVRSIRFNLEPETANKTERQTAAQTNIRPKLKPGSSETHSTLFPSSVNSHSRTTDALDISRNPRNTRIYSGSTITSKSLRSKRSLNDNLLKNDIQDLQAEEAKIFRPLFVYRQQVAKRQKLRNDRKSVNKQQLLQRPLNNGKL